MKRLMTITLTGMMVLSTSVMAFADSPATPAEVYADLAGITLTEAFAERGNNQKFGDLAKEKGIWTEFSEGFLSIKKEALEAKVSDGTLSQEQANAIIEQLENCDGTGTNKLLEGMNMQFGKNTGGNQGNGFGAKSGNGLRDGSGNQNGQKNGKSRWND